MKRFALVTLVLVLLFALSGVASAAPPVHGVFTISGSPFSYQCNQLNHGRGFYSLAAGGWSDGTFAGDMSFEEWGTVDVNCVDFSGTHVGKNYGTFTIALADGRAVIVDFRGTVEELGGVKGNFQSRQAEGPSGQGLQGHGTYAGGVVDEYGSFVVTFTGEFH